VPDDFGDRSFRADVMRWTVPFFLAMIGAIIVATASSFIALKISSATTIKDVESQGRAIESLTKIMELWTKNVQDNTSALTDLRTALANLSAQILLSGENSRAGLAAVQNRLDVLQTLVAADKAAINFLRSDIQRQIDVLAQQKEK
jgi:hypothetical protein